jgi:transposase
MEENKGVRRNHPPAFRAKVAIEAIKGEKTISQLSGIYGVHSSLVTKWKAMAFSILEQGFAGKREVAAKDHEELESELYRQIGQLKVQIDWLKKKIGLIES